MSYLKIICAVLCLASCVKKMDLPDVKPKTHEKKTLGKVIEFKPEVSFRRRENLVWQEVFQYLPLYAYDSVRTESSATTKIHLSNNSELFLSENTLIIITPDYLNSRNQRDRAVVRNGSLTGTTQTELWLLTSAALLKIKAKEKKVAKANVEIQEGKKLKIMIEDGEGIIAKSEKEIISLPEKKEVTLSAPMVSEHYGFETFAQSENQPIERKQNENKWHLEPYIENVGTRKISKALSQGPLLSENKAAKSVPKREPDVVIPNAELFIDSPANRSEINEDEIEFKGRVSRKDVRILVNGNPVKVSDSLSFSHRVNLVPGINPILIQMINHEGNSTFKRWMVRRKE